MNEEGGGVAGVLQGPIWRYREFWHNLVFLHNTNALHEETAVLAHWEHAVLLGQRANQPSLHHFKPASVDMMDVSYLIAVFSLYPLALLECGGV